ncbi:Serralysin G precursor [Methylophaga muralis]|uniref:Serralysin G n=2 Tax=Methylophaga muralis TaxID=291169 RepID=A0A1E3GN23_9GAMM|nr:Serralysin G precursor [Methylophaga muralis]
MPGTSFEYTVTDESNNDSASVEVVISSGNDTVVGNEQDNIISGGPGNDILTGGAGTDIFVWNAGDEGVAGAPAMDIVTDFNIAEGDVLDFSDILVGEESGNLTDFISITEDGSDIVIELKPDATDVTQIVTLQGKSLVDLGLGGFDTSTQQAEMINKLVQDGHVSVDS